MKYLANIDLNKNELQNAILQNLGSAPANPGAGQIYYNSADVKFYGFNGVTWIDLGQVLDGATIVNLINASTSIIDDNNLSSNVIDAVAIKHSHTNAAILNAMEIAFTNALKTKLDGITVNATKTEASSTNGNIKINGVEDIVYTHPGTGTNPHATTKADIGLNLVENKTSATIRSEITSANINTALGFTPKKIIEGLESARPVASGTLIVYIATDTKKIYFDQGVSNWVQIGGQDTIDWGNVTGKPSTFTPAIATISALGGIKVGANLTVDPNGVLNANDNPTSYLIKQEQFIATEGQTVFNLTKGTYRQGIGALSIFMYGSKIANNAFTESSTTSLTFKNGLSAGDVVLVEYIQLINVQPYPIHANEHLTGGADAIPLATITKDGLMSSTDKVKINGSYTSAQVDSAIQVAINGLINGAPGALDTILELANALGNDPNFATSITNSLATKVDKVTGKQLSTEDFTTILLAKLNGIAANANNYSHPANHAASIITQDASNRFVTDIEKISWNSRTKKYAANVGDGTATTINITHSLNTLDVTVAIREVATPFNAVITDWQVIDVNSIRLLFAVAPTASQYRVVVVG